MKKNRKQHDMSLAKLSIKQWLFNPFLVIAGWPALGLGLLIALITAITSPYSSIRFDGVIGAGFGVPVSLWMAIVELGLAWLSLSVFLIIAGIFVSKSSFRFIDLLGTQALARFPLVFLPVFGLLGLNVRVNKYLVWRFYGVGEESVVSALEILLYVLVVICITLAVIWTVILMFNAFKVSCNVKGTRAGIAFTLSLIAAQVLTKIIHFMISGNAHTDIFEYYKYLEGT